MDIAGKHEMTFNIEYEIKMPKEFCWNDNNATYTATYNFNGKQVKAYRKGVQATAKYLNKMRKLGFVIVEQTEADK